jgi:hypothetical protein
LGKWKYWLILVAVMGAELARQQGFDNFYTASVQDAAMFGVVLMNWRRLGVASYVCIAVACGFIALHQLMLGVPVSICAFGVRSLVYTGTAGDIIAAADRELVPTRRAFVMMALLWGACAVLAVYQQITGFRYLVEDYNAAIVSETTDFVRIPSVFFSYSTYAKFCLCGLIVLVAMLERQVKKTGVLAGAVAVGIAVGIVLTGQRAAVAVAGVVVAMTVFRSGTRHLRLALMVATLGLVAGASFFPEYFERVETSPSFERVDSNLIESLPLALEEKSYLTGIGLGRITSAANRFDTEFGTDWYVIGGDYEGSEGFLHSLLIQGGLPWLVVSLLALAWCFRPSAGQVLHYFVIAYGLWAITHDIWGSVQPYLFMILPVLAVRDLGLESAPQRQSVAFEGHALAAS